MPALNVLRFPRSYDRNEERISDAAIHGCRQRLRGGAAGGSDFFQRVLERYGNFHRGGLMRRPGRTTSIRTGRWDWRSALTIAPVR